MGFTGSRLKNTGKLARINALAYADPTGFAALINNDTTLKSLMQDRSTIIGSATADVLGTRVNNIKVPPVLPMTVAVWMGELGFDTTDKTHVNKKGNKDYPYQHAKAALANSLAIRGRIDDVTKAIRIVNDFENLKADGSPNPGGIVGDGSHSGN